MLMIKLKIHKVFIQVKIVWIFFCQDLNEKINTIINIPQKHMNSLTEQEVIDFNNAKECFICNKEFTDTNEKCRDHDHYT